MGGALPEREGDGREGVGRVASSWARLGTCTGRGGIGSRSALNRILVAPRLALRDIRTRLKCRERGENERWFIPQDKRWCPSLASGIAAGLTNVWPVMLSTPISGGIRQVTPSAAQRLSPSSVTASGVGEEKSVGDSKLGVVMEAGCGGAKGNSMTAERT
jgi:hypothetical protein